MELTWSMFLIVCPLVFLAGFVDAIAGGGGLISLPAYMFAGVPVHNAIATNKLSSCTGTVVSTWRLIKNKRVDWYFVPGTVVCALAGSVIGANLALIISDEILKTVLVVLLPIVAFCVLRDSPRPRPESGKVCRSDTRPGEVCEHAERSEGSNSAPVRKAPVSACKPLCAILLAKASVYPLLLVKANVGRLCEKLKNALKSGLEQRCNSNFLAIFVEVILWFFDRLRKAPALLAPEPSLSLTLQVQRKF